MLRTLGSDNRGQQWCTTHGAERNKGFYSWSNSGSLAVQEYELATFWSVDQSQHCLLYTGCFKTSAVQCTHGLTLSHLWTVYQSKNHGLTISFITFTFYIWVTLGYITTITGQLRVKSLAQEPLSGSLPMLGFEITSLQSVFQHFS